MSLSFISSVLVLFCYFVVDVSVSINVLFCSIFFEHDSCVSIFPSLSAFYFHANLFKRGANILYSHAFLKCLFLPLSSEEILAWEIILECGWAQALPAWIL